MPVRSSVAAEKAMYDGDIIEAFAVFSLEGDTPTIATTRANKGDGDGSPTHAKNNKTTPKQQGRGRNVATANEEENELLKTSTRTCRRHLIDDKPLLQRQDAVVWNRPSMARPPLVQSLQYMDTASTISSLSQQTLDEHYIMAPTGTKLKCLGGALHDSDDDSDEPDEMKALHLSLVDEEEEEERNDSDTSSFRTTEEPREKEDGECTKQIGTEKSWFNMAWWYPYLE